MAGVTFREAARKKMLWMALAADGAFLILFEIPNVKNLRLIGDLVAIASNSPSLLRFLQQETKSRPLYGDLPCCRSFSQLLQL